MKKSILTISFLLFFSIIAHSQEIRFGVKGGLNLSSIKGDFQNNSRSIVGFHVGGLMEISALNKFAIQPEIFYSQEGGKDDSRPSDGPLVETKLSYIKVPVMAKYYVIQNLSLMAGPQFGYLISAKRKNTSAGFGFPVQTTETDIKDKLKSFELGLGFGAEYRLPLGIFAQLRYVVGLSNINDEDKNVPFYFPRDNKNNVFQVSVGYSF